MVINRRIQHGLPTCLTGLLEVMGHDFAVRNWRQDILHCGHHGHEESQAYGKSCMRLKDSSPAQVKLCVVSGFQDVFLKYSDCVRSAGIHGRHWCFSIDDCAISCNGMGSAELGGYFCTIVY